MKRFSTLLHPGARAAASVVVLALLAVVPLGVSSAGASSGKNSVNSSWPTSLIMGEVGQENSTALTASLAPVAALMKKKLDITLNVVTGTSYASMIEAQQAGKAQLVFYGPFSYFIASQEDHLKIEDIGISITAPHTNGGYYSQAVINPKLSPAITSLKDARGKKVCFSDPSSTSGYLYPTYGLLSDGINPTKDITPVFAGTDTATVLAVAKGDCQVGFTYNNSMVGIPYDKADIKRIWQSEEIPGNPVAVSDSVPKTLRTALENLFVKQANSAYLTAHGYCSSETKCTATMGGQWGWANPDVTNFAPIKHVCEITKSPSCTS
jgi:phosphonate transport system substrate-binding protein